jgi:uridylate kinase
MQQFTPNITQKISQHKRILLKISGEALMGEATGDNTHKGIHDIDVLNQVASDVQSVINSDIQICMVVGGGNIYRGRSAATSGMEQAAADYIGMLGTVINALALQSVMESHGIHTRVMSAVSMTSICEPYIRRKAKRHMEKGRVVIFAGGTGNPFFSTDTAAVLRAVEMNCDTLLKGTKVDGVYDEDPFINPNAVRFSEITYDDALRNNLNVMDMSGFALARENMLPIKIFSIKEAGNLLNVLNDNGKYTIME